MRMLSVFSMISLLGLTACCSSPQENSFVLQMDPVAPVFINEKEVRSLQIDIANAKILLARWRIKAANDRFLVGEISEEERDTIIQPIIDALHEMGVDEIEGYLPE